MAQSRRKQEALFGDEKIESAFKWFALSDANHIVFKNMERLFLRTNSAAYNTVGLAAYCFSLELRLKGILTIEESDFKYEHDLLELYKRLSGDSQKYIDAKVQGGMKGWIDEVTGGYGPVGLVIPKNARDMLKLHRGAYTSLRYGDLSGTSFLWPTLLDIVSDRADDVCPEWAATRNLHPATRP